MAACRISADRIYLLIKALRLLYYEHYGNDVNFKVNWFDDPEMWEIEGSKSISIKISNKSKTLLYKITFFLTTETLQAEGINYNTFVTKDFPCLKTFVGTSFFGPNKQLSTNENADTSESDSNEDVT